MNRAERRAHRVRKIVAMRPMPKERVAMDAERTKWFHERPVRKGLYECLYGSSNAPRLLRWDGKCFVDKHGRDWIVTYWRGLTAPHSSGIPMNAGLGKADIARELVEKYGGKVLDDEIEECDKLRLAHVEVLTALHRLHPELVSRTYAEFIEHAKLAAGALLNNKPSSAAVDAALERGRAWARKLNAGVVQQTSTGGTE